MSERISRRTFVKESVITSVGGALAVNMGTSEVLAQNQDNKSAIPKTVPDSKGTLPKGKICDLEISRMMLGGNLLTHFTHSRDLKYVYALTSNYNTVHKIWETMALAESFGIDTLVIHTAPGAIDKIKRYRKECGGKMKCIVCPTANIEPDMKAYSEEVKQLVDDGIEAIYLWGVRADRLVKEGKMDLVAKCVDCAKEMGVPSGVGAHDLNVIKECEKNKVNTDFYLQTFHHHKYPSATLNYDSMWCRNPEETAQFVAAVEKPWIAFKVMAAGAIPPKDAFRYAFENGADHVLVGMFDFEIEEDARIVKETLASVKRTRPWRS